MLVTVGVMSFHVEELFLENFRLPFQPLIAVVPFFSLEYFSTYTFIFIALIFFFLWLSTIGLDAILVTRKNAMMSPIESASIPRLIPQEPVTIPVLQIWVG